MTQDRSTPSVPHACTCGTGPWQNLGPHSKWCALAQRTDRWCPIHLCWDCGNLHKAPGKECMERKQSARMTRFLAWAFIAFAVLVFAKVLYDL